MRTIFYFLTLIAITACGGGGGSSSEKQVSCGASPTEIGQAVKVDGNGNIVDVAPSSKKYEMQVIGTGNTVKVPECAYVTKITVGGTGNSVTLAHTASVDEVVIVANALGTIINLPSNSNATVTDLGNGTILKRTQ